MPHDGFPPRSTVYNIFRKFQDSKVRLSGASRANPARHFASAICPFGELVLPARKHLTGVPRSPSGGCLCNDNCDVRPATIRLAGFLLITRGPGAGPTTIAAT